MPSAANKQLLDKNNAIDDLKDFGGAGLRAAREAAKVEIATLSFELRIPKNYLEALETEEYDQLPGTTYGFGYIRSICKFLDIDPQPYLDSYKMKTAMQVQDYVVPNQALEPRMSGPMVAMIVVLVLFSGYIGWQVLERSQFSPFGNKADTIELASASDAPAETASTSVTVTTTQDSVVAQEDAPTDEETKTVTDIAASDTSDSDASDESQTATAEVEEAPELAQQEEAVDAPSQTVEETPVVEVAETVTTDPTDIAASNAAQANVRQPSEEILISASAAAWVEVVSENGDVLLSKLFQPGDDFIAPANQKLYLSTGNAGGLVLQIPGLDEFTAGEVGEIIRDLPLSRDSIRSRRSAVSQ